MSSIKTTDASVDEMADIDITLMTLRKPTELKKVIESIPKPPGAVPKNGLPIWYKLGLESKLPMPKVPQGKIIFSRGRIGEDVRRLGLGSDSPAPTFDLTDPYCNNVSYDYVPMHDPHLAHHFAQKPARCRMKQLGFCTKDGRAVCSLREFNQYRKYLYNQFMDRIHTEMKKLDERARDDLTLKRVEVDVARRLQAFTKEERAREHLERIAQEHAEEWAEKKRLAKEQEQKIRNRMKYLAEFNEKQRRERAERAREKENRIRQRVQAAAEMELRRKITMVRQWRTNEKNRLNRLKQERLAKQKQMEDEANRKWTARIEAQNMKIQEEAFLLKIYTEDMNAAATRRTKKAEIYAYNTDLELQRIRLANWKALHGGDVKAAFLVKKMGIEFEKSKRGAKGMSLELAHELAHEAMANAVSTQGDPLMTLGQARINMDAATVLPSPPLKLLEEVLEAAVMQFARQRVHQMLRNLENSLYSMASEIFFQNFRPSEKKRFKRPRWTMQVATEMARQFTTHRQQSIGFGEIKEIAPEFDAEVEMKSIKDRPPTPVPSKTQLAEVTFIDRLEDLPDPVAVASYLPERKKLIEMINMAAKLLSRSVAQKLLKGMDITLGIVTLPRLRQSMEWGEAVESMAIAAADNRVNSDAVEVRHTSQFLARRILRSLLAEMKEVKKQLKNPPPEEDFYVPEKMEENAEQLKANTEM
ncbi:plectin-like [Battus philenor]|uniref:plectin-like n=1 Tax=Battus philenor TaxID=42288 RepID=UPI0035CEA301